MSKNVGVSDGIKLLGQGRMKLRYQTRTKYQTSLNEIGASDKVRSIGRSRMKSKCWMKSEIWIVEWNQLSNDREVLLGKRFMDLGTTG
jgi:hypothetical protein